MQKYTLAFLFTAVPFFCSGQIRHMFDSIKYDLKHSGSFFVSLDGKNSIIRDRPVKMFGFQAGLLFNKRTNLYAGYYASYKNTRTIYNPTAAKGEVDSNTVDMRYRLEYLNIGCEYYFKDTRKWRFSIPFSIGLGAGRDIRYKKLGNDVLSDKRHKVVPLELGFNARYKLFWWMWISGGLGTRLSLASTEYNGSYYTFGLSLRTGEIYNRFRAWYEE